MLEILVSFLSLPVLASLVVVLLIALVVTSKAKTPSNIPPFPVKPYPFLGHIPYLRGGQQRALVNQWRKQTGDIFSIYMGPELMIVMNGYDVLKEAMVKQADTFSDRPVPYLTKTGSPHGQMGIFWNSGETWKEQRTVSLNILREFGMGKNFLAEKIMEEANVYLEVLAKLKGKPSNVRDIINAAVSNIICAIMVGKRFEYDDQYFLQFLHIFNSQVSLFSGVSFLNVFPWLRFVPGDPFNGMKMLSNIEITTKYFSERFIGEIKKNVDPGVKENFIASYILDMEKKQHQGQDTTMSEMNLTVVINHLFIAGSETTSTTILWFFLYMIHFPDIQKKVFKCIDDAVGLEKAPTIQDKPKMNYLNAAIMETQRIASIVPFSLLHKCNKDTTVDGFNIPKDTTVMINLDSVLHDEKTWGDPLNFRPERFLDDGKLISIDEFIPFSLGRRVCLGEALAKMELFLFLSATIQRFEILPADPENLPPREDVFGITAPPKAYEIRLVDRREA